MIRPATLDDQDYLLDLGERMHSESIYSGLRFDREKASKEFHRCLSHGLIAVCEVGGRPVGVMSGYVKQPWFSSDLVAFEEVFYLDPDHRSGRNACRLIEYWGDWARRRGAVLLRPTTSCGNDAASRLYEHLDFSPVGQTFAKYL